MYDYFIKTKFEVDDMIDSLKLVMSVRDKIDIDVYFFAKGFLYSSIRNHSPEDQIKFMYKFDKLNLLVKYIPRYLEHL